MKKAGLVVVLLTSVASMLPADTIKGFVSDSHCGAKHASATEANDKCVNACLKHGSDPVLVQDGKVLTFDAESKDKVKAFAGQSVSIDGSQDNGVVKVTSISKGE